MVFGIDVAADRLNCVALDMSGTFVSGRVYAADELGRLSQWAAHADVIAIDAPAQLSTAPHSADESLAPKFRVARCAEIALGRDHRIWVPWTSPTGPPVPRWIATGLDVYSALANSTQAELIEVFPYAGFRVFTRPARLTKKTAVAGIRQRIDALRAGGSMSKISSSGLTTQLMRRWLRSSPSSDGEMKRVLSRAVTTTR
jgi:predicted nuclease with RNAse H fold